MGNTTGTENSKMEQAAASSEPGVQPVNRSSIEGQTSEETKKISKAAPKMVGEASEYELVLKAEPQNGEYTFDEDVKKFYSQVVVEAPKVETTSRPSLDIVAVLDVSGSMSGDKISLVRKSMRRLIRNLGSQDRVALVTFDSRVSTVMQFCNLDEQNKTKAYDIIANLRAGTSTNLCGGVVEGVEQLLANRVNDVASILLFTDGQANVGHRDTHTIMNEVLQVAGKQKNIESWSVEEVVQWLNEIGLPMYCPNFRRENIDGSILKMDLTKEMLTENLEVSPLHVSKFMREAEKLRGAEGEGESTNKVQGFRLHTFGFGSNHNATLLGQMAEHFDGMYFFMENEESIKSGFANCLGGLMTTVALDIEVSVQFNPECTDGKVYKESVTVVDGLHKVHFADLQSEEKRNILVSCSMPAKEAPEPDFFLFETSIKYNNAIANIECNDTLACVVNRNGKIEHFNEGVDETRNRGLAALALREANKLGDANDLKSARQRLQVTIDEIGDSRSALTTECRHLSADLHRALDKTSDRRTWANEGQYYTRQNFTCYSQQRACNYDDMYETQKEMYNTSARETMNEEWRRLDSLDSDVSDE